MKKYTKHLWLVAFLLLFFQLPAQVTRQYKPKKEHTLKAQALEKEIQAFIEDNIDKYDLTQDRVKRLRDAVREEQEIHQLKGDNFNKLLLTVKKNELRKLYFKNKHTIQSYNEKAIDESNELPGFICFNESFEDSITDEYTFTHDAVGFPYAFGCNMSSDTFTEVGIADQVNTFGDENVTIVDNNLSVSNGNDPTLELYNISVPRVHTGSLAVKLNNSQAWDDNGVTTLRKRFIVNSSFVSYSFSLIVEDPDHAIASQPHFIARLYNQNNEIVTSNCIVADVEDTEMFFSVERPNQTILLYTDWQCGILPTDDLEPNEIATLEFVITDCAQLGHFGTVYIDDICDGSGCEPVHGIVHLNLLPPEIRNCPSFPINVCGTYIPPRSIHDPNIVGEFSSTNGLTLEIQQNGGTVSVLNNPVIDTVNRTFCFELNESDFGANPSGGFEFLANANFVINNQPWNVFDASSNVGDDITYNNCIPSPPCPDCLTITTDVATGTDNQQAYTCINANNTISGTGTEVVYRAGKEVLLLDGFDALYGTKDRFHIEGCTTNNYVARTAAPTKPDQQQSKEITIDLIEHTTASSISIYPNPTNGELNIVSGGASVKTLTVFSLDGKVILKQQAAKEDANSYKLNINAVSAGIYLLSIEAADGTVTSHKIIKN